MNCVFKANVSIWLLTSFLFTQQIIAQVHDSLITYTITELEEVFQDLKKTEQFDKMLPYTQAAVAKATEKYGKQDTNYARVLYQLGFAHDYGLGDYNKAMELYLEAAQIQEEQLPESIDYATTMFLIADIYNWNLAKYDQALPLYIQSKNIQEKILGKDHPDFATTLNSLAALHQKRGDYDLALSLYNQTKNIREKALGEDHPDFAITLNNLAALYRKMGDYESALPLYIQSKNIKEKTLGKDHTSYARSLNNLAFLYESMMNYELALPLYLQAKDIFEKELGKEDQSYTTSLSNLAGLYEIMKSYQQALSLYKQCIEIEEKTLGKDHPYFASTLNNLARLYQSMEKYDQALSLYIQAKDIYKSSLGKEHLYYARSLNNLAFLHQEMGSYDQALPLYIQAKDVYENVLGVDHPSFARLLNNIARLHYKMGNYPEAEGRVKQVIRNMSKLQLLNTFDGNWKNKLRNASYLSNEHIDQVIGALYLSYQLLEKDSKVVDVNIKQEIIVDLVFDLLDKMRGQVSNDKDKLRLLEENNRWLQKSLGILSPAKTKAFYLTDKNKSVLLLQATRSEANYRLGKLPDSLVWQNKKMLKTQIELEAKLYEKRPKIEKDSLRVILNEVNQRIETWRTKIREEYPKYHKLQYEQVAIKAETVQGLLDEKTALIEYAITDSILHVFKVDQKSVVWHQEAIVDSVLINKVKQLHQSLSDYNQIDKEKEQNFAIYTDLAYWFYQKMLDPVLKEGGVENLIIVTDGQLGHLPFESFLVEPAKGKNYKNLHYLVQDYNISYNYSASLWQENKTAKKQNNNGQMLAIAANYSKSLDTSLVRGRLPTTRWMRDALSPLPAAREEVEALSDQFKGFFGLDSLATERVLNEKAGDYAIIHLATHGLLDEKRPILSSLALTEDGDSLHDNFLQAHEISKMELNADLVVLSACETGYGRFETGNGIASLARAFMYAGVSSLVVSLWQVNDQSTSIIMQNFYKHLASGKTKSEALRQAKLDYIEAVADPIAAHPAFWSPFILIGDESPIKLQQKGAGSWVWWGVGAGALLLAGLGFGLARRKKAA